MNGQKSGTQALKDIYGAYAAYMKANDVNLDGFNDLFLRLSTTKTELTNSITSLISSRGGSNAQNAVDFKDACATISKQASANHTNAFCICQHLSGDTISDLSTCGTRSVWNSNPTNALLAVEDAIEVERYCKKQLEALAATMKAEGDSETEQWAQTKVLEVDKTISYLCGLSVRLNNAVPVNIYMQIEQLENLNLKLST